MGFVLQEVQGPSEGVMFNHGGCAAVQRGELNELQKKSPEDLWKEDLAVFVEELEVHLLLDELLCH